MLSYGRDEETAEEAMMSQLSKQELLEAIHTRYRKAKKAEKQHMLDEFVAATGYHRKYAIRILKAGYSGKKHMKKRGRQKVYQGEVVVALEQIWQICGQICSKHLHPFLPATVAGRACLQTSALNCGPCFG